MIYNELDTDLATDLLYGGNSQSRMNSGPDTRNLLKQVGTFIRSTGFILLSVAAIVIHSMG
jgi:hypothetical protein